MAAALDQIADFPALVEYLRDELEWPIPDDISLDEATYDVTPEEIGLKAEAIGGGIEIKQLRPLNRAQPWGVFFLNLPNAKLPVTLVRNILGKLAVKKRASANKAQQAAFAKHDLLFIAATGASAERRLAFAHFADDEVKGDAAILKVLGWDANDTPRRLGLTETSLKTRLHWPDDPADADHWRKQWGEAFVHSDTRAVVRDSKAMAVALAALARRIRERAKELIAAQTDTGSLVQLHKAFREALIHDLMPEGFADTYAQTIAYGLLSAAISRSSGALVQENVTDVVHPTSPFLKEMLGTFIEAGGRRPGKANAGLDFDELGITEVVELLRNADMEAVLADFDRRNPDEDPVIHFYELFLREYDAEQKVKRGVFYTPRPVVGFIVRSVDEVLKTEFGLEDGLASTATWGEVIAASKGKEGAEIKLPEGAKESDPFVRILDPATGTGTFLVECVDLIHNTMVKKWFRQGLSKGPRDPRTVALWNDYVPKHLLPRLTGFELMMAPYAIAHVKLGLKLADTGYAFGTDACAQIYLTNALEPAQDLDMQLAFMSEALAHEAKAANEAKETRFTVVVGNPPYLGLSKNMGKWITDMLKGIVDGKRSGANYFEVDGSPLGEKKVWLQDDYVKFMRLSQLQIERSGVGIVSLVTNHGYLENPTFRGLRNSLLADFNIVEIFDLHGNSRKGESSPDGSVDENVFDIEQGVAVALLTRCPRVDSGRLIVAEIWGRRENKARALNIGSIDRFQITPKPPLYLFKRHIDDRFDEYASFAATNEIFPFGVAGIITARDDFAVDTSSNALLVRISDLRSSEITDGDIRRRYFEGKGAGQYPDGDSRGWKLPVARLKVRKDNDWRTRCRPLLYRPFDQREVYYADWIVDWPRPELARHMSAGDNLSIVLPRSVEISRGWEHVIASTGLIQHHTVSLKEVNYQRPLWLKPQGTETRTLPNIAPTFAARVSALIGLAWDDCIEEPKQGALGGILPKTAEQTAMFARRRERGELGKSFGPRDLFDYIYAVLHSPAYRARYADYLKSDFARIPLPGSRALFEALVPLGTELVELHLLDTETLPILKDPKGIRLAGSGEAQVAHAPTFDPKLGRVTINPTRWFETVPEIAWNFHVGGYQPAQKWLKDRAAKGGKKKSDGRVLTDDDILHYRRMIAALTRTAELMPKIDEEIEKHGGWPDAFRGMTDKPASPDAE